MGVLNIVGMGYIGLPTALMFAANDIDVVGTDINKILVEKLNDEILSFEEEGLKDLFKKAKEKSKIKFTTQYCATDKYIVAVPTPYVKETKKVDLTYVKKAIEGILDKCLKGAIIVIESTISPGSIENDIYAVIQKRGFILGKDINIVHAPERIIPGNMIYELENNSRIIGSDEKLVGEKIKKLYESFCKGEIIITSIKVAEMCKVVENTFRDINIAFANEIAQICNQENINVYDVISIANRHPRVNIMQPGPGVGGHCISIDPWFLVGNYHSTARLIETARSINDSMPQFIFGRIKEIMQHNNITKYNRIGLYGLSYKENVDDVRESPTLQLLEVMKKNGIENLKVYDPLVNREIVKQQYFNFNEFISCVDIVIIMVGHNEIKEKQELLKDKIIYDTRNVIKCGKKIYKI